MPPSLPERLQNLKAEVHHLDVLPAAAVRARGRSRGRRQLTAVLAAGAVVATMGIAFAWPNRGAAPTADRPAIGAGVSCVVALPDSPSKVHIRLLDGGAPAGMLATTVEQLRARDFTVLDGATGRDPERVAALRYGPAAIGAATVLRASLHGDVAMRFDLDRPDETIDLTVGPTWISVATPTEVNQNLAAVGQPSPPPECSEVVPRPPAGGR
jgi:hypothetical protein